MTIYRPEEWHSFFMTVGAGAAALTGLVVVAMSMHLRTILTDPVMSHRARMTLTGLGSVFMRCSLVLMGGQGARAVAIELFVVCLLVMVISVFSYAPISRIRSPHHSSLLRTMGASVCYGAEMLGAILLFFGIPWGLTVAAIAMVANFSWMLSSSWLLLLGVRQDEIQVGD